MILDGIHMGRSGFHSSLWKLTGTLRCWVLYCEFIENLLGSCYDLWDFQGFLGYSYQSIEAVEPSQARWHQAELSQARLS